MIELPETIRTYWYAFDWDVEALWALDLPPEPFPIRRLEWHLDVPLWPDGERRYQLTPRQVLRQPFRYEQEYHRLRLANLVFPMEITRFRGRWMILDGVHRLAKAHEDGQETVMVRKVPPKLLKV